MQSSIRLQLKKMTRLMGVEETSDEVATAKATPQRSNKNDTWWFQERLHLYESDVEQFITDRTDICDMVFVDAYDGDDVFPYKPWDPDSIFLKELGEWLHPDHGPVVVNLHSDMDIVDGD
ncbi:S-adenosyl-L-methionine-dependent methyltransferases superfamily protein [Tanacetum coccineum]